MLNKHAMSITNGSRFVEFVKIGWRIGIGRKEFGVFSL